MYSLALRLGRSVEEIGHMSVDEFVGWLAYFSISSDMESAR